MPQGEERRLSRGRGACLREGSRSGRSPGRIKINVYTGEEGVKYVGVLGAEEDCGKATGERSKRGPTVAPARGEGGRGQLSPLD